MTEVDVIRMQLAAAPDARTVLASADAVRALLARIDDLEAGTAPPVVSVGHSPDGVTVYANRRPVQTISHANMMRNCARYLEG